jgi:transcriptional repressor NrdR
MNCPYCDSTLVRVVDKRNSGGEGAIRRRRECLACKKRFTTYERIENLDLFVIKKDGKIETFSREKVKKGILKSFTKVPTKEEDLKINSIVEEIEQTLLNRKDTTVKSTEIGNLVLERLKEISPIAYMRFASIYKHFNSIEEFEKEIRIFN